MVPSLTPSMLPATVVCAVCRAYSRAEISCMGLHFPPIAGIDYVPAEKAGKGCPPVSALCCRAAPAPTRP
jgi:hypothetical protein